ncbi:protein GOLM2-like isoform X2 [Xenopus laevis]|uniref:Protein GOLM2 n=1 Tax=Xenopus laevis TaxID=8355 RepID=A0A8J0UZT4_XENLA|nr:protein GOLM2-like isoform X2 [Xenopus laevis]
MVGFGAPRRTGRLPPFVLIALLAVIGLLAFNYWSVSARQAALHDELLGLQAQVQRTEVARSRLEKRNSELIMQMDTHRRQMEQKQGEYQGLGERLQARDMQAQRCEMDKSKLQNNVSLQMADISRLKEQLAELRHEFLRQEDQLHEFKNNNTFLQKSLQEESQQCAQQLAERKREYEENLTKLKEDLDKQPKKEEEEGGAVDNKMNTLPSEVKEKVEDPSSNRLPYAQDGVKPESDAGMPEIEDNEPAKEDGHPNVKNLLPGDKKDTVQPPEVEENALQLEPHPQKQMPRDSKKMSFNLKQSRFFDENESPVDPQHGSKVADYNGDDGNVGEYEADKQAELAYNEEEDGDGGEEDVQEDDDHDGQADAGEYHKDHLNETL